MAEPTQPVEIEHWRPTVMESFAICLILLVIMGLGYLLTMVLA